MKTLCFSSSAERQRDGEYNAAALRRDCEGDAGVTGAEPAAGRCHPPVHEAAPGRPPPLLLPAFLRAAAL